MLASVFKAMPPRRPQTKGSKITQATIARMKRSIREALVNDFSPDSWIAVTRALTQGTWMNVENLLVGDGDNLPKEWADRFVDALGSTYLAAANDELARVGARMKLELYEKARKKIVRSKNRFTGVPHSDEMIRKRAAELVVQVSRAQKQAIRETLIERYNNDRKPEAMVRSLKQIVGLDPPRARALRNYENQLRKDEARDVTGKVERYREKLLQNRAETIARTESVAVENMARVEAWGVAADAGEIPIDAEQEWVTSVEPCVHCIALDGQRVPVGESFASEKFGQVAAPPLHPNCYCTLVLRTFKREED